MHYIIIADPQTLTAAGATTTEAERSVVELGDSKGVRQEGDHVFVLTPPTKRLIDLVSDDALSHVVDYSHATTKQTFFLQEIISQGLSCVREELPVYL